MIRNEWSETNHFWSLPKLRLVRRYNNYNMTLLLLCYIPQLYFMQLFIVTLIVLLIAIN